MSNNGYYDPYARPVDGSVSGNVNVQYAGFWVRLIAFLIDSLIIGMVEFVIMIPMVFIMAFLVALTDPSSSDSVNASLGLSLCCIILIAMVATFVAQWLYFAWFESSKYMATPGKSLLGLAVTDNAGNRISFGKATLRYFAKILTNMIIYIGSIVIAFSSKKQGLYDIIADTYVVKK